MTKESKLTLILQILLILVLVPIGVVSLAAESKSFSGKGGGTTQTYNWFYFQNNQAVSYQSFSSSGYNKNAIINSIINDPSNAYKVLENNKRVFSLNKEHKLYINNFVIGNGKYKTVREPGAVGYLVWEMLYNKKIIASDSMIYVGEESHGHQVYAYNSKAFWNPVPNHIIFYKYIIKYIDEDTNNLTNVPDFCGSEMQGDFKITYAASFFDKTATDYTQERLQQVIWSYTNSEVQADMSIRYPAYKEKNSLYYANETYNEYEEQLKKQHKIENNEGLEVQKKDGAGSFLSEDGEYVYVGPFYIGDYAYAEAKDYIDEFSGKGLEQPNLLAGLVGGSVTIDRYKTELGVGTYYEKKLEKDDKGYIGELKFGDTYAGKKICVFYGNGGAGEGAQGGYKFNGYNYIKTPDSLTVENNTSTYPRPNSTFYVQLPVELLEDETTTISNISFDYRQTEATGKGDYVVFQTSVYEARNLMINAASTSAHQSGGAYICPECKQVYIIDEDIERDGTHVVVKSLANANKKHILDNEELNTSCSYTLSASDYTTFGFENCKIIYYTASARSEKSICQPILLIEEAKTTVKKATLNLEVNIMLSAEVTIETHIDKVTSVDGITKYENTGEIDYYGYEDDDKIDYGYKDDGKRADNGKIQTTTGDNQRRDELDDFDVINQTSTTGSIEAEDAKWSGTNIETWKEANPVVLEVGDAVEYLVEVKHYSSLQQIATQIECFLPTNIDIEKGITIQAVYEIYENGEWHVRDNGCLTDDGAKNIVNISGNELTKLKQKVGEKEYNYKLTAKHFPQDEQSTYTDGRGSWLKIPVNMRKLFRITVTVADNKDENTTPVRNLQKIAVKITNLTQWSGKAPIINRVNTYYAKSAVRKETTTSRDWFKIKEYNVVIDKYISEVSHEESRGGVKTTYQLDSRKSAIRVNDGWGNNDETKDKNPVSVEYGDRVTYTIRIYNTTNDVFYNVGRGNAPYYNPQNIYVDIRDTLPEKYSDLRIEGAGVSSIHSKNEIRWYNVPVPAGSVKEIKVSFIVEEVEKSSQHTNTVKIDKVTNINKYVVVNNGKRLSSSDKYQLNDYNVTLEEYISQYNAEMAKYNNANGFTNGESEGFINATNSYSSNKPLDIEKYETLTFATKVINSASGGEYEDNSGSYGKYNTRVRPTKVSQTVDFGLSRKDFRAVWYTANGTPKRDITSSIDLSWGSEYGSNKMTYTYTIPKEYENIILAPGEYIVYYLTVEVIESNMRLEQLSSQSEISILSNVNRNINSKTSGNFYGISKAEKQRIVTDSNIATKTSDADYVRLKDLVIAGTVWLDADQNGYKQNEAGKSGITVKLYRVDETNPVAIAYTNDNGFYTFGRQWKAKTKDKNGNYTSSEYIKYYVEFEYDGISYKATDVYGGDSDGQADGMHNLGGAVGSGYWRQGYSDLPGDEKTQQGDKNYMIDSNAYEFDSTRNAFNSKYETIGYDQSYNGTNPNIELEYNKNGHISTLKYDDTERLITARSFITQNLKMNGAGVTQNIENTNTLFLQGYNGNFSTSPETEYLKFINLGLVIREPVDLSIESDVYSVKTTINGEEMTYDFNDNDADSTAADYSNKPNAYKLDQAYNLDLYAADFNYRNDEYYDKNETVEDYKGKASELTVEVTYRIRITNKSIDDKIPIEAAVNEMAIYYDQNFMSPDRKVTTKVKNPDTGLLVDGEEVPAVRARYGTEDDLNDNSDNAIDLNDKGCILTVDSHGASASRYSTNAKLIDNGDRDIDDYGYSVLYLSGTAMDGIYIAEGESKFIEITFTVDKDASRKLKITDDKPENMGLEMIAEIGAYTTRYGSGYNHTSLAGKTAGLVDIDSNPGNLLLGVTDEESKIEKYSDYEDDTYKVGIKMNVKSPSDDPAPDPDPDTTPTPNSRYISGIVWDDARSEQVGTEETGIQYIGNGQYNSGDTKAENANANPNATGNNDKPVAGVKVSLIEIVQTEEVDANGNAIYYEYPAKDSKGKTVEVTTDENGKYTLKDFIPGYYIVRFDYGYDEENDNNIIYNGQDYKSTTYYNGGYYTEDNYKTDNIASSENYTYFDNVKMALATENKSDAQDDEIRRLNVNSYSETMTTAEAQVFANASSYKEPLTTNTHMYADSAIFYAKPVENNSGDMNVDASQVKLWNIKNLDFGLQYRPESAIKLDKNISLVELVTSDGKTLVKLYFETKDGKRIINKTKSVGEGNVQFVSDKEGVQGLAYINMDTEILTGCAVNVEYEMTADNNSEVDRINANLDEIRYEKGAVDKKYESKVYVSGNYNANGTAAEFLASQYYDEYNFDTEKGIETYNYLRQLKKSYNPDGKTTINEGQTLAGQGYYGIYLGQTYYTGEVGNNDVVAKLKVDHILDYIDNDMTFNLSENSGANKLWKTVTPDELENMLSISKNDLVDKEGVSYASTNRSNLVLSVDDNRRGEYNEELRTDGNASLSRFLSTSKVTDDISKYQGKISLVAQKVLSVDDIAKGKGLKYESIAEVVQFTTVTGRRTTLPNQYGSGSVVGNTVPDSPNSEDDSDTTEVITISPPTGLPLDK